MPIRVQCPGCGRQFQAADRLAGRRVKCPDCATAISVPALHAGQAAPAPAERPSQPPTPGGTAPREEAAWYAETVDGREHGPVTKAEVERLVASGQMNVFCRVRHQAWPDWKWAGDLFPELGQSKAPAATGDQHPPEVAVEPLPGPPTGQPEGAQPRVVACPDCGRTVSTRASQCPHCGCPAVVPGRRAANAEDPGSKVSAEPTYDGLDADLLAPSHRKPKLLARIGGSAWVVHTAAVLLLIAVVGLGVAWWAWRSRPMASQYDAAAQTLLGDLAPPAEPPPVAPTPADETPFASAEERRAAIEEAAAEVAGRLDGEFRAAQAAKALLDQTQVSADLVQALAQGDLDAIPESLPTAADDDAASTEPLYDSLFDECLAYLGQKIPREQSTKKAVGEAARSWEHQKRASLEQQFTEDLTKHLGPG